MLRVKDVGDCRGLKVLRFESVVRLVFIYDEWLGV